MACTTPLWAGEPTTKRTYSLGAAANLFEGGNSFSILQSARALRFDAVELSLSPSPSSSPAGPPSGGMTSLKLFGDAVGLHKDFCSLNPQGMPGPTNISGFDHTLIDFANQFNAGVVVSTVSADNIHQDDFIKQMQRLARYAVRKNVSIALDTPLGVDDINQRIDTIGSTAVGIAFDPVKISAAHSDPYQAFRLIGHKRIVQVRITSPADRPLQDGLIQLDVLKEALDDTGWNGWIILQSQDGRPLSPDRLKQDANYLRSVFNE